MVRGPETFLDKRYSSPDAEAVAWQTGREALENAEVYWLSTVRPDGRPHVTPLIGVWREGALHFATGPHEQKARNLESNRRCVLTTGCNKMDEGMDVVLEGEAVRVTEDAMLRRLAGLFDTKYGWKFEVRDGSFWHEDGGQAHVFAVAPETAYAYGRGATYSHTRWRFPTKESAL